MEEQLFTGVIPSTVTTIYSLCASVCALVSMGPKSAPITTIQGIGHWVLATYKYFLLARPWQRSPKPRTSAPEAVS